MTHSICEYGCIIFSLIFISRSVSIVALLRTTRPLELQNARQGRPFIVRVPSFHCQVGNSEGACYLKSHCVEIGGQPIGTCYDGFGVCCKLTLGCSKEKRYKTIREKTVILKDTKSCRYVFKKPAGYCQMKLEIRSAYALPTNEGECADGSMTIVNSATVNNFRICGDVKDPLYATYVDNQEIVLSFNSRELNPNLNYEVKVNHIRCDARERVPDHCLLELSESSGQVQSFGYDIGWIRGQKYNICIKKVSDRIKWTKCDRKTLTFNGDGPIPSKDFILSKMYAMFGAYGDSCREGTNYISIFGNRYCGNYFPNEVTGKDETFTLAVNFKGDDFLKIAERMILWPELNMTTGECPDASVNNALLVATATCSEIKSIGGGGFPEQRHHQCFCLRKRQELIVTHSSIADFNIGFCLEYTQI